MSRKIGQALAVFLGVITSFAVFGNPPPLLGTELTRTIDGLTESQISHLVFFVEDTQTNPQITDTDQIWIVQTNNVGNASYLLVFRQDTGQMISFSDLDMPLLAFMDLTDLSINNSCESNPTCFGGTTDQITGA